MFACWLQTHTYTQSQPTNLKARDDDRLSPSTYNKKENKQTNEPSDPTCSSCLFFFSCGSVVSKRWTEGKRKICIMCVMREHEPCQIMLAAHISMSDICDNHKNFIGNSRYDDDDVKALLVSVRVATIHTV